jgi:hypothetical protein
LNVGKYWMSVDFAQREGGFERERSVRKDINNKYTSIGDRPLRNKNNVNGNSFVIKISPHSWPLETATAQPYITICHTILFD